MNVIKSKKGLLIFLPSIVFTITIIGFGLFFNTKLNRIYQEVSSNKSVVAKSVVQQHKDDCFSAHTVSSEDSTFAKDFVYRLGSVNFFVPNYPVDVIQRHIVDQNDYFEGEILRKLDSFIPNDAVILDVGANIGNHSVYWATQDKVKKVYSFEPVKDTFKILERNIKLNNLKDKVELFRIGLSDSKTKAKIESFNASNIGGTHIKDDPDGDMTVDKLDNIKIKEDHIDFVKIDIEGHEVQMLNGARETFMKYKPKYVFIESFKDKFKETKRILESYNYRLTDFPVEFDNYLFEYKD